MVSPFNQFIHIVLQSIWTIFHIESLQLLEMFEKCVVLTVENDSKKCFCPGDENDAFRWFLLFVIWCWCYSFETMLFLTLSPYSWESVFVSMCVCFIWSTKCGRIQNFLFVRIIIFFLFSFSYFNNFGCKVRISLIHTHKRIYEYKCTHVFVILS